MKALLNLCFKKISERTQVIKAASVKKAGIQTQQSHVWIDEDVDEFDDSDEDGEDDWDWDDAMGKLTKRNPVSAGRNPQVCLLRNMWLEGLNP